MAVSSQLTFAKTSLTLVTLSISHNKVNINLCISFCVTPQPTYEERAAAVEDLLCWFMFAIPRARARPVDAWCSQPDGPSVRRAALAASVAQREFYKRGGSLRTALVRKQLFFPDRRLLQYDCGKLIELDALLRRLKVGGHRALIFTQMAKMLDVLEAFLNLHGHTYMRLDGSTKPEQRQVRLDVCTSAELQATMMQQALTVVASACRPPLGGIWCFLLSCNHQPSALGTYHSRLTLCNIVLQ